MIRRASGSTNEAAITACTAPEIDLRQRHHPARHRREQAVLDLCVKPKSATIGSATDCTAASARLTASTPGSSAAV